MKTSSSEKRRPKERRSSKTRHSSAAMVVVIIALLGILILTISFLGIRDDIIATQEVSHKEKIADKDKEIDLLQLKIMRLEDNNEDLQSQNTRLAANNEGIEEDIRNANKELLQYRKYFDVLWCQVTVANRNLSSVLESEENTERMVISRFETLKMKMVDLSSLNEKSETAQKTISEMQNLLDNIAQDLESETEDLLSIRNALEIGITQLEKPETCN